MLCFNCDAAIDDSANFCAKCGAQVPASSARHAAAPPPSAELASASVTAPPSIGPVARYAGFWRRVVAAVIDGLVQSLLTAPLVFIVIAVFGSFGPTLDDDSVVGVAYLLTWIASWLYFALMHSSSWQATLGKRALGIKVTTRSGERIGFGRATGRFFATILSAVLLGIGYLMAAFTARRQALHDMLAGTLVVSRHATPEGVASGLAPPRLSAGLIAAAVLVGVIPVLGMLAAIAIPAYYDYTLRSQVSEALNEAGAYKSAVVAAIADGRDPASLDSETLALTAPPVSSYLTSIEVAGGAIQLTFGGEAGAALQEARLALVPGLRATGEVVWICGYADVPTGVTALLDQHADYTSVEPKYLPPSCR